MKELKTLELINEILLEAKSSERMEEGLSNTLKATKQLLHVNTIAVILIDPETEYLRIVGQRGLSATFQNKFKREIGVGRVGEVIWTCAEFTFGPEQIDAGEYEDFQLEHPPRTAAIAPISTGSRTIGYLQCERKEKVPFGEEDRLTVRTLANLAGFIADRAQAREEARLLAVTEPKLDVYNFNFFYKRLEEELSRSKRTGHDLAVGILDVDNLKSFSSMHGKDSAEKLMKELVRLIKAELRAVDVIASYGPDELVVLLLETHVDGARKVGDRLVKAVRETKFTEHESPRTSISIGLATAIRCELDPSEIICGAQKALFKAQLTGRDRAVIFQG